MAGSPCLAAAANQERPRKAIDLQRYQCDKGAGESEKEQVYAYACADALAAFPVASYAAECNDFVEEASNLLDWVTLLREHGPRPAIFFPWARGRFLLSVPCSSGAYNLSSVFFDYDERQLPAKVTPLRFPQPDGSLALSIYKRGSLPQHRQLVEYRKSRGMGDAGFYARYRLSRRTLRPVLLEAIEKQEWDGEDRFQWDGRLRSKPKGKTWYRTYPP